jgi:hypothetical protein
VLVKDDGSLGSMNLSIEISGLLSFDTWEAQHKTKWSPVLVATGKHGHTTDATLLTYFVNTRSMLAQPVAERRAEDILARWCRHNLS